MDSITIDSIKTTIVVIMALYGAYKVIKEIVKSLNDRHDREQSWDKIKTIEDGIMDKCRKDREQYDKKIEEVNEKIEKTHTDTEKKLQEIKSEQCLMMYALLGALDGLKQLGCNGNVTEARDQLDKHLNKQAHGVE